MSNYINAGELMKRISHMAQETGEVAPVIHAQWEKHKIRTDEESDRPYYKCSNCGGPWVLNNGSPKDNDMNYCPRCGAKMDGGKDESSISA